MTTTDNRGDDREKKTQKCFIIKSQKDQPRCCDTCGRDGQQDPMLLYLQNHYQMDEYDKGSQFYIGHLDRGDVMLVNGETSSGGVSCGISLPEKAKAERGRNHHNRI